MDFYHCFLVKKNLTALAGILAVFTSLEKFQLSSGGKVLKDLIIYNLKFNVILGPDVAYISSVFPVAFEC